MSILKIKDANNNFVDVPSIKGRGISSIQKTSTSGLVDTYTITYSDGTTSTFNVTNGAGGGNENLDGLNYYECTAFGAFKVMFLYSGDYDYDTSIDGYSFALKLLELIYGLSTLKSQSGIDELINDDNGYLAPTLKRMFSTLLNALTEDSSCMCSLYSTTVYFAPNDNYINVLFGDGTSIVYSVSEGVQTITFNRSNTYHAGTNISIANDGTINNTYTLPSDVVQDSNYVHTDNNYTTEEKTKLANLEEENETLYNDHPDITATGTNVTLNGTGDLKMKVDVGGNSTQVQYEGYNKLEGDTSYINTNIDSRTKLSLELWLSNSTVGSQDQKILKATTISSVGRYYYIFTPDSNTVGIVIKHNGAQTDLRKIFSIELQSGITYTISLDITGVEPSIKGGFSFDDVMIYDGTIEKLYEPYVGGTASPNPNYKQDINNVEGNVVVISKNSDNTKSNSVTFPLSQGQKLMLGDTLEDDGIHHERAQTTFTGTTATLSDAKTNGAYLCDQKTSGNLSGQTLTFDSAVTNAVIEYELETETTEAYTSAQQTAYNKLKEMQSYYDLTYVAGTSDNTQPIITAHAKKSLKVMQNEIDSIESRLSVLE